MGGQRVHLQHPHRSPPVHRQRDDQQQEPDQRPGVRHGVDQYVRLLGSLVHTTPVLLVYSEHGLQASNHRVRMQSVLVSSCKVSLCLSILVSSGPAPVTRLQVSSHGSTDSLQAQWDLVSGDLDSYRVLLVQASSVIKNQSVSAETSSIVFHALRPGGLYRVVLTSVRAGQVSRQAVAEGRTGEGGGGMGLKDIKT